MENVANNTGQQYLTYKPRLKRQCIILAAASALSLIAAVLIIFLPTFSIDLLRTDVFSPYLPKIAELDPEVLLSDAPTVNFSVFDEVYAAFAPVTGDDAESLAVFSFTGIFQLFGVIFLAAGMVSSLVSAIKNILHVISPDNYALEMYDKIKSRTLETGRKRGYYFSSSYLILCGVIYEIFAIVFSSILGRLSGGEYVSSYFAAMTGVNSRCIVLALVLIAVLVLFIWSKTITKQVRLEIMREDYNIEQNK